MRIEILKLVWFNVVHKLADKYLKKNHIHFNFRNVQNKILRSYEIILRNLIYI